MGSTKMDSNQLDIPTSQTSLFTLDDSRSDKDWYGLRIDHRQLIDALEYEYLTPIPSIGISLGLNAYADCASKENHSYPVFVYLKIDPGRLPLRPNQIGSSTDWQRYISTESIGKNQTLIWPHVLPLSCISEIAVLEEEHLQRIVNVKHMAGNLRLPLIPILRHDIGPEIILHPRCIESEITVTLPCQALDAYRGSICMAFWGVPKMHPWIQALCISLSPKYVTNQEIDPDLPSWIRLLPWDISSFSSEYEPRTLDEAYWKAAIAELVESCNSEEFSPYDFIDRCAENVKQIMSQYPEKLAFVDDWQKTSFNLLKGTASFQVPKDIAQSVPIALQMLLLRPKPEQFRSWVIDYPDVPVAIWFAGLLLCGLLAGYHRLALVFRGYSESKQTPAAERFNQLLLFFLLESLPHSSTNLIWPHSPQSQPTVLDEDDQFNLYWDQQLIGSKRPSEREDWLRADLNDLAIASSAIDLAKQLEWACTHNSILLSAGTYTLSKKGKLTLKSGADYDKLLVVGESVELAGNGELKVMNQLDKAAFRRCILQNGGDFRRPGLKQYHPKPAASSGFALQWISTDKLSSQSPSLERVSGLSLVKDFLSEQEEEDLLKLLDAEPWELIGDQDSRKVQHYGWRYLYKAQKVSFSDRIGQLPHWADELACKLCNHGLMPYVPDQVIVNEYRKKQGIAMHIDCLPCFADVIVSISMIEEWTMKFQKGKQNEFLSLPRRSALVLSGSARSEWRHGITPRIKDPSGQIRGRRVSLTFRKVRTT